jgi:hypothetical protein
MTSTNQAVLYRTELGAQNYAMRLLTEDVSVVKARSILLSADPPQWTVKVRFASGVEMYAKAGGKGYCRHVQ